MEILGLLEMILHNSVDLFIIVFEMIGVGIIIVSGAKGLYGYISKKPDVKLALAKGLAMGLEFKLGSEILRTVIIRDWMEIATVASIIALRASLTFLIHWEIKQEEKHQVSGADLVLKKPWVNRK